MEKSRANFSGKIGFVLAAAGSAVGLGNLWRFPYLAAKDGGGVFLLFYLVLAVTFGFTLLTTEIAIGRKTGHSPLTAYGVLHKKFSKLGFAACLVPVLILPYYCVIGGWVFKYCTVYFTGLSHASAGDSFFTDFITGDVAPMIFGLAFLLVTAAVVLGGVNKGIEKFSKVIMPILLVLIIFISVYSLTLHYEEGGEMRTGLQGLKKYLIPDFSGMTLKDYATVLMDAMGQLFFSISVAMGIMVAYGSYVKKDVNLMKSINQIEIFDTVVAMLAGMMIIPAVYVFSGIDGMGKGPGLMFVSLPKVFDAMGTFGIVVGAVFFLMTAFAAITSSVSVMEAIVSSIMDRFSWSRKKSAIVTTIYGAVILVVVCLGYNKWYFEITLPNGETGQILDILDYISNSLLMPLVALFTCILIGWVVKTKTVIDEVTIGGVKFGRKRLYEIMIRWIAPIMLIALLLQAFAGMF